MDTLEYLDILKYERRALLAKNKVSSMWLATRDTMKSDYGKNYKYFKRKNRKEKAQLADFSNILRIRGIFKA